MKASVPIVWHLPVSFLFINYMKELCIVDLHFWKFQNIVPASVAHKLGWEWTPRTYYPRICNFPKTHLWNSPCVVKQNEQSGQCVPPIIPLHITGIKLGHIFDYQGEVQKLHRPKDSFRNHYLPNIIDCVSHCTYHTICHTRLPTVSLYSFHIIIFLSKLPIYVISLCC